MQTSTPSRQASVQVDTREATIAMVQSMTSHGAWKWTGLNPTATVEVHQHCTPSLAMGQMAAQHGDAGLATTTMDEPLSTCVLSMVLTGVGPQSEMDRLSTLEAYHLLQVGSIGVSSSLRTKAKAL